MLLAFFCKLGCELYCNSGMVAIASHSAIVRECCGFVIYKLNLYVYMCACTHDHAGAIESQ